ncbi:MAG TPA: VOC family protein [Propionicimonas sp.]|nr:VOC family protein [Propionicimonas sp.]
MHITQTAISLNVPDPGASGAFLVDHFGFEVEMEHDGMVSVRLPGAGCNVIYLRTGLESFKPKHRAGSAGDGLLLALVVDALDADHRALAAAGVKVVTPPETEPWGERFSQYEDPNGIIVQLVQWM